MTTDTLFWIASMTKPVTGVAILMLQDEGKLSIDDPAAKYLPELRRSKTPSGKPANITIKHILTHTSGLGEARGQAAQEAKTLADLVAVARDADAVRARREVEVQPDGINSASRIVEVITASRSTSSSRSGSSTRSA